MSELYSKLKHRLDIRQREAQRVGLGFDPNPQQIVKAA
jgi:hypothetical protein